MGGRGIVASLRHVVRVVRIVRRISPHSRMVRHARILSVVGRRSRRGNVSPARVDVVLAHQQRREASVVHRAAEAVEREVAPTAEVHRRVGRTAKVIREVPHVHRGRGEVPSTSAPYSASTSTDSACRTATSRAAGTAAPSASDARARWFYSTVLDFGRGTPSPSTDATTTDPSWRRGPGAKTTNSSTSTVTVESYDSSRWIRPVPGWDSTERVRLRSTSEAVRRTPSTSPNCSFPACFVALVLVAGVAAAGARPRSSRFCSAGSRLRPPVGYRRSFDWLRPCRRLLLRPLSQISSHAQWFLLCCSWRATAERTWRQPNLSVSRLL